MLSLIRRFAGFVLSLHQSIRALVLCLLLSAAHGTASAQSPFGNALSFNGTNQGVTITNFGNIIPTTEITIEFWAYTTRVAGQSAFILDPDDGNMRCSFHINYANAPGDGNSYWDFGNLNNSGRIAIAAPPNSISNWVHYALVASQNGNSMSLYTNGVLQFTKTGMSPFVRGNYDLLIGGNSSLPYNGTLDDFRVWSIARSAAQIQASFNTPLVGDEPYLRVYYKFDDATGSIATNSATGTGATYNGTVANSQTWVSSTVPPPPPEPPAPVESVFRNALRFSGERNVTIRNFGTIIPATEITVEFWAYSTKLTSQAVFMLNPPDSTMGFSGLINYANAPGNGNTYWDFGNIDYLGRLGPFNAPTNSISNWVHYAFVASRKNSFMKLYTNGVLQASKAGMSPFVRGDYDLMLGYQFNGRLDDFRVWSTARSAEEVQANFNAPLLGDEPHLAVYYKFDSTGGNVVTNSALATGATYDGWIGTDDTQWVSSRFVPPLAPPPALPLQLIVTGISNTVATLSGTVDPGGLPTTTWFEWWIHPVDTRTTTPLVIVSSGIVVSNVVSGLTPGLIYHGRMVASNAVGVARGIVIPFGSPRIELNSGNVLTNECHTTFTDPGARIVSPPLALAAGYQNNLAIKGDQTVIAWWDPNDYWNRQEVPFRLSGVVAISSGWHHGIALKKNGTVVSWGVNDSYGATNVPVGLSNVVAVAAGYYHNLALKSDGTVVGWGNNGHGQANIPAGLSNVVAISSAYRHSLALKSDGTVIAWGAGTVNSGSSAHYGQSMVPAGLSNVVAIAAGSFHSLAIKSDGTVVAWGAGTVNSGQFPHYGQSIVPDDLTNVVAIACGNISSLALKRDGTLATWGTDYYALSTPPSGNFVSIAAGATHNLALKTDGTVVAWAINPSDNNRDWIKIPVGLGSLPLTVPNSVDTNSPGSYLLTYTCTNGLGGIAAPVTRTVVVADNRGPEISLLGNNPYLITNLSYFVDPGATAFDLCIERSYPVVASNGVNTRFPGTYTISYRSTDGSGNTAVTNRTVIVALPPTTSGDLNGDGIVSPSELEVVYSNYVTNSPWLSLTNVAGLGGTNVTFELNNSVLGSYTVQYSTNLTDWLPLGPATPRYLFTDTNAPANPQRSYRLVYP